VAETSNIAWTRSTFNGWIGCTKIGSGCDHCYAAESRPVKAFGIQWGAGQPRHRTSVQNWNLPLRWNKQAAIEREAGFHWEGAPDMPPGYWPVFCSSLADVFDNEVPADWRRDLFSLIELTPNLKWLLVTKRIGNVQDMVRKARTTDWLEGQKNVRLMITVCNQEEADRDIPKLLALNCKNGISYEPALGPVDWTAIKHQVATNTFVTLNALHGVDSLNRGTPRSGLDWIIVGGESNQGQHKARRFDIDWAYSTVQQCKAAGVPVFVKQLGSAAIRNDLVLDEHEREILEAQWIDTKDRAGANPDEWPEDLRVREFPQ